MLSALSRKRAPYWKGVAKRGESQNCGTVRRASASCVSFPRGVRRGAVVDSRLDRRHRRASAEQRSDQVAGVDHKLRMRIERTVLELLVSGRQDERVEFRQ